MHGSHRIEKRSLSQKLIDQAGSLRGKAEKACSPEQRDKLLMKAMEAQTASDMLRWLNPSELRAPE
jgi:hypothetical protein